MREILFRGKRVEDPIKINPYAPDGWVYGYLIICDDGCFILPNDISGEMYIDGPYKFRANDIEARIMLAKVDENTIGQYTGITDKNRKKIFEGDICLCNRHIADSVDKRTFEIIFDGEWIGLSNKFYGSQISYEEFDLCEVIGNIYDNPELLENKNDN